MIEVEAKNEKIAYFDKKHKLIDELVENLK